MESYILLLRKYLFHNLFSLAARLSWHIVRCSKQHARTKKDYADRYNLNFPGYPCASCRIPPHVHIENSLSKFMLIFPMDMHRSRRRRRPRHLRSGTEII